MKTTLGTFVEIGIDKTLINYEQTVTEAFAIIEDLNQRLNFHSPESELNSLNNANGRFVKMSRLSVNVIKLAKQIGKESGDKFNCTIGNGLGFLCSSSLDIGKSDDIEISGDNVKIRSNTKIILDGIAKGFAIDLAVNLLKRKGVTSGWVNAGGDLRVFGNLEWPVYIKDPNGVSKALIKLKNSAIATSFTSAEKDFNRFTARYANKNSNNGLISVVSNTAWRADALTKVAANLKIEDRKAVINNLGGQFIELCEGLAR